MSWWGEENDGKDLNKDLMEIRMFRKLNGMLL